MFGSQIKWAKTYSEANDSPLLVDAQSGFQTVYSILSNDLCCCINLCSKVFGCITGIYGGIATKTFVTQVSEYGRGTLSYGKESIGVERLI